MAALLEETVPRSEFLKFRDQLEQGNSERMEEWDNKMKKEHEELKRARREYEAAKEEMDTQKRLQAEKIEQLEEDLRKSKQSADEWKKDCIVFAKQRRLMQAEYDSLLVKNKKMEKDLVAARNLICVKKEDI